MKQVICPRCRGAGVVEERQTLPGIATKLDRPSFVNDDDWTDADKTALCEVPIFMMPEGLRKKASERPPAAPPPSEPTVKTPVKARELVTPPEPTSKPKGSLLWPTALICLSFGAAIGLLLMRHKDWVTSWMHALLSR